MSTPTNDADTVRAIVAQRWREVEELIRNPRNKTFHPYAALYEVAKADPVLGKLSPFVNIDGFCLNRGTEAPGYVDVLFGAWGDNEYILNVTDGHGNSHRGLPVAEGDAQTVVRLARELLTEDYPSVVVANKFEIGPTLDDDPITIKLRAARPRVERCTSSDQSGWLALRRRLWLGCPAAEHAADLESICASPDRLAAFMAYGYAGKPLGFVEVSTRTDYVNGTSSSPVGFIEGLYVIDAARFRGIGRMRVQAG